MEYIIPEKKLFQTGLIIKLALADINERVYVLYLQLKN
jgi:hypothetical protein